MASAHKHREGYWSAGVNPPKGSLTAALRNTEVPDAVFQTRSQPTFRILPLRYGSANGSIELAEISLASLAGTKPRMSN